MLIKQAYKHNNRKGYRERLIESKMNRMYECLNYQAVQFTKELHLER